MNRLLTYPLLIWEFIGYMSIFTKQKQTSDLLPPAIGKLSIGPKSACPSFSSCFSSSCFSSSFSFSSSSFSSCFSSSHFALCLPSKLLAQVVGQDDGVEESVISSVFFSALATLTQSAVCTLLLLQSGVLATLSCRVSLFTLLQESVGCQCAE